jgi:hypothetical protein
MLFSLSLPPKKLNRPVILHAAGNEFGELSGVSPMAPRFCTGKLTNAARQLSHS